METNLVVGRNDNHHVRRCAVGALGSVDLPVREETHAHENRHTDLVDLERHRILFALEFGDSYLGQLDRLDFLHRSHDVDVARRITRFADSAVEVDLTGQVNAETAGGHYVGAVGGQVDYVRAAALSPGGCSMIALPSTAQDGAVSRIVPSLSGPVTTARSDVDVVITEFGAAQLRGRSLRERAKAMIAIAHPAHREALERQLGG